MPERASDFPDLDPDKIIKSFKDEQFNSDFRLNFIGLSSINCFKSVSAKML